MNIRIATTRVLVLKDSWFQNDTHELKPGSHFLEKKKIDGVSWLQLEGRSIGLTTKDWGNLKNKGVIPKSLFAKIIFKFNSVKK